MSCEPTWQESPTSYFLINFGQPGTVTVCPNDTAHSSVGGSGSTQYDYKPGYTRLMSVRGTPEAVAYKLGASVSLLGLNVTVSQRSVFVRTTTGRLA